MAGQKGVSLKQALDCLKSEEVLSTVYDARTNTIYVGTSQEIHHFNLYNKALGGKTPSQAGDNFQGGYIYKTEGKIGYKQFSGSIKTQSKVVWEAAHQAGESTINH